MSIRKIQSALISVYCKDRLAPIVKRLNELGIIIYSTGGTEKFIRQLGVEVVPVEKMTDYPAVFDGRVKTLHPKVFGGILYRRQHETDVATAEKYGIPPIDLVIVDLYPFEKAVGSGDAEEAVIEKIDIGGVALVRAAAKNFNDVMVVCSKDDYSDLISILDEKNGGTSLEDRKLFAAKAFDRSSHYDATIFNYLNGDQKVSTFKVSASPGRKLRYGENPHQKGYFFGNLSKYFDQVHGKAVSYNNLADVEAAVQLMGEFGDKKTVFGILKHNNACGIAVGNSVGDAYQRAVETDTASAFGGVFVTNKQVDLPAARQMNKLFFEILIASSFSGQALTVLKEKKNRILLVQKKAWDQQTSYKSLLNGVLVQDYDRKTENSKDLEAKTQREPTAGEERDLLFAVKICKHLKSNAIVLARKDQMLANGAGQTSRVSALQQAIAKAEKAGIDLRGAVMASDAFFPFPDCVEAAHRAGITAIIQPGGSVKDQLSIDYCNTYGLAMVFTGIRHFRH